METRICKVCKIEKNIELFAKRVKNSKTFYRWECKDCGKEDQKKRARKHYDNNMEKCKKRAIDHYNSNKIEITNKNKIYNLQHREEIKLYKKEYRKNNKEKIAEEQKQYKTNHKNDPDLKLRNSFSANIRIALKKNNANKSGQSFKIYLPYSIEELKQHIESLFSHTDNLTSDGKVWMTWKNQGLYRKNQWDDNNSSTWKWQLDHIIPHSTFKYTSMNCQEFIDCWALTNLRPYSAKQNQLDGATKIRHNEKENK